ncbi:MAG: hypothetical protein KKF88_01940 [Alphaproteobacteria bacterium]|nr:hypothetical protein [Alphaproteobacteria bacterium]
MWKDLCPADTDCGGFLARTAKTFGYLNTQEAIEHMYACGWNPDAEHKNGDPTKAFRGYLSKSAQGLRDERGVK